MPYLSCGAEYIVKALGNLYVKNFLIERKLLARE